MNDEFQIKILREFVISLDIFRPIFFEASKTLWWLLDGTGFVFELSHQIWFIIEVSEINETSFDFVFDNCSKQYQKVLIFHLDIFNP